jgi:hypothetical protein
MLNTSWGVVMEFSLHLYLEAGNALEVLLIFLKEALRASFKKINNTFETQPFRGFGAGRFGDEFECCGAATTFKFI